MTTSNIYQHSKKKENQKSKNSFFCSQVKSPLLKKKKKQFSKMFQSKNFVDLSRSKQEWKRPKITNLMSVSHEMKKKSIFRNKLKHTNELNIYTEKNSDPVKSINPQKSVDKKKSKNKMNLSTFFHSNVQSKLSKTQLINPKSRTPNLNKFSLKKDWEKKVIK